MCSFLGFYGFLCVNVVHMDSSIKNTYLEIWSFRGVKFQPCEGRIFQVQVLHWKVSGIPPLPGLCCGTSSWCEVKGAVISPAVWACDVSLCRSGIFTLTFFSFASFSSTALGLTDLLKWQVCERGHCYGAVQSTFNPVIKRKKLCQEATLTPVSQWRRHRLKLQSKIKPNKPEAFQHRKNTNVG